MELFQKLREVTKTPEGHLVQAQLTAKSQSTLQVERSLEDLLRCFDMMYEALKIFENYKVNPCDHDSRKFCSQYPASECLGRVDQVGIQ